LDESIVGHVLGSYFDLDYRLILHLEPDIATLPLDDIVNRCGGGIGVGILPLGPRICPRVLSNLRHQRGLCDEKVVVLGYLSSVLFGPT